MIKEFKLFEAKQVGIIYHWTQDLSSLNKILLEDRMISNEGYISFSRNKNLNFLRSPIKITFDGDKMSNYFRFEPHMYASHIHYKNEAEERIKCKYKTWDDIIKNDYIKGIKKFIIGIEISINEKSNPDYYPYIMEEIEKINKLIPNIKIKINNVDRYSLIHRLYPTKLPDVVFYDDSE